MEKVLITGGSHAEIPLIKAIHKLGYQVISTGLNTDGLGHLEADFYIPGDFSDYEFVTKIAKENQIVGIVSGCNDFAYLSTAYACDKIGLSGHDSLSRSKLIHNKNNFGKILNELNLSVPKFFECKNISEIDTVIKEYEFPVIVKPVDLTGGKGVCVCNSYFISLFFTQEGHAL